MKTKTLISLLLFVVLQSQAQIEGYWKGQIDLGTLKLEMAFNITANENGYSTTLDVPAQGAFDFPVDETIFQDKRLQLTMSAMDASYSGTLKEGIIEGEFTQRGMTFPLNLVKAEKKEQKKTRPQDPQPPFDYHIEEVTFVNEKEGNTLVGTLTIPKGEGPFPAMVLVSGSGQQVPCCATTTVVLVARQARWRTPLPWISLTMLKLPSTIFVTARKSILRRSAFWVTAREVSSISWCRRVGQRWRFWSHWQGPR